MGLFMDGDGIPPCVLSLFPGNANEQTSLKPLEKKILRDYRLSEIYLTAAMPDWLQNPSGNTIIWESGRYIVTQSIKKLNERRKGMGTESGRGFKRVSDDKPVDITKLPEDDKGLYYKDEPYTTKKLHQRLIITYSPKYAAYQRSIRDKQVERAQKMLDSGKAKREPEEPE